ncbi:hypothetical protein GWK47_014457 [Chionoecetes opilio]|uniref:Uncharacterized protein n=1 Tax=Chionoecetes opilio TaxID=41210 RepID=A0A8J4Y3P8_CHIOP|nr:hypothetical protein GWK47_014457 [Chionoecetes opilio]
MASSAPRQALTLAESGPPPRFLSLAWWSSSLPPWPPQRGARFHQLMENGFTVVQSSAPSRRPAPNTPDRSSTRSGGSRPTRGNAVQAPTYRNRSRQPRCIVLVPKEPHRKGVLLGISAPALPLDPVLEPPSVAAAEVSPQRRTRRPASPTRQVLLTRGDQSPPRWTLSDAETLRVQKVMCQSPALLPVHAFGHHQRQCSRGRGLRRVVPTAAPGHHAWKPPLPSTATTDPEDRDHHGRRPPDLPPLTGSQRQRLRRLSRPLGRDSPRQEAARPSPCPRDAQHRPRPHRLRSSRLPRTRTKRKRKVGRPERKERTPPPRPEQVMEVNAAFPLAPSQLPGRVCLPLSWASPARRCEQAPQTLARTYTFQEARPGRPPDHLRSPGVTGDPAAFEETDLTRAGPLPCEEALLRREKALPRTLPIARPHFTAVPHFYDHVGEKDGDKLAVHGRPNRPRRTEYD